LANDEGDVDVVTPVARQAVDLAHDDEVGVEFRPVVVRQLKKLRAMIVPDYSER